MNYNKASSAALRALSHTTSPQVTKAMFLRLAGLSHPFPCHAVVHVVAAELVVPREEYEPPERPYAAAITASGMAYMAPPRPMSADSYGRAGPSRLSVSGETCTHVYVHISEHA